MKIIISENQKRILIENIEKELKQINVEPSEAQKKAGNYKMAHIKFAGFNITIENPKGSYRIYKNPSGRTGKNKMHNHYGYFTGTEGRDGDQIDVFLGNAEKSKNVYVVDQNNEKGEFDESKVMLGFSSKEAAKKAYMSNYSKGWKGFREITEVPKETFKKWLYDGKKQRKPFSEYRLIKKNIKENINLEDNAYHGTNADFNDFDFSYMGSGAGAQSWAYGSYFTKSPAKAKLYGKNCYKVNIPDDNGKNYIYADKELSDIERRNVKEALYNYLIQRDKESYPDNLSKREFNQELNSAFIEGMDGNSMYGTISSYLGSDKSASQFCYHYLNKIGFKYFDKGNENIVIFNPKDAEIISKKKATDNKQMNSAKDNKNDEFYTRMSDIVNELSNYSKDFSEKIIYCNCDNPSTSNFYKYFKENFKNFKLKMLVSTGFDANGKGVYGLFDGENEEINSLKGSGDFNSMECQKYLVHSDIIVSNPPFSKFRPYINNLLNAEKKFLVLGNMNAIKYKEIFPYFKENKLWTGYTAFNKGMYFNVPDNFQYSPSYKHKKEENGEKIGRVSGVCWFTNLGVPGKNEKPLILQREYNENNYLKYDNYDAINVNKIEDIPLDYNGYIGAPITIIDKINQDGLIHCTDITGKKEINYQIIGIMNSGEKNEGIRYPESKSGKPLINGKFLYTRVLIHKI